MQSMGLSVGVSVKDRIRQIITEYVSCIPPVVEVQQVEYKEPVKKEPVKMEEKTSEKKVLTQEEMAVAIALDMSGKKVLSRLDRIRISTDLYESIRKMVYQLASRYEKTCGESAEDLSQDCLARVISQLWRFNPEQAKFTTWTWWVCRSVLNKKYRDNKKMMDIMVPSEFLVNEDGHDIFENLPEHTDDTSRGSESSNVGSIEMMDAIRILASRYPSHKQLIFEVFGNPESSDYIMPTHVSIAEAAKTVGVDYTQARMFFSQVVRPFFRKNFVEA